MKWFFIKYKWKTLLVKDKKLSTNIINNQLQIKATPKSNDLVSLRETYITLGIDNSVITVVEDTISSGSNLSGTGVIPESSY